MPGTFWDKAARKGSIRNMQDVLDKLLKPNLEHAQKRRGGIEEAFLGSISDQEGFYKSALTSAEGLGKELFKPGGQIASMRGKARGKSISSGFAPEGAEGAERGILSSGMDQISNRFAQEAAGLEQTRIGALAQAFGISEQAIAQMIGSAFTGQATIEGFKASERDKGWLGLGIGPL